MSATLRKPRNRKRYPACPCCTRYDWRKRVAARIAQRDLKPENWAWDGDDQAEWSCLCMSCWSECLAPQWHATEDVPSVGTLATLGDIFRRAA